ncbi:hypothetical protein NESM_000653600 [Novymonas esmeraldas]|uniref:Arrestin-like N-terminal domain-containing protein n=1 Tax=Novymonas esmeraldas TaxID=1808958 RepID=A0AAW0ESB5_9TRYP
MDFSLTMSAAAHRRWYIAGDLVKVRLSLTCVPEAARDAQKELAPLRSVPRHNHFSVDSSEAESHETDLRVRVLDVELVGLVDLDASVMKPISWPEAATEKRATASGRSSGGRSRVMYTLYRTGKRVLREDVYLRRYECTSLEFVFRLPEGSPPTFKGRGAEYRHDVSIAATWSAVRTPASARAAAPRVTKVKVPLAVFNCLASVAQLPLRSLFPLPPDAALVAEDFHFQAITLASAPAPSIGAPLSDVMKAQEAQLRTSLTVRRDAKATTQTSLAAQRQPLSLVVPCGGVEVLQVHLRSSCAAVGDSVQGSFTVLETADEHLSTTGAGARVQHKRDMDVPVPVSVTVSVELLECVTPEWALTMDDASVADTKAQGMENFVCVCKRVIDRAQFCLLDTPCVPFEFTLPAGLVPASTITDVTSFLWQLRVVLIAVPRRAAVSTVAPGVDRLGPLLEPVTAVFPLLIVPPPVPSKVRQGAVW